jgi:hypothetical protein
VSGVVGKKMNALANRESGIGPRLLPFWDEIRRLEIGVHLLIPWINQYGTY